MIEGNIKFEALQPWFNFNTYNTTYVHLFVIDLLIVRRREENERKRERESGVRLSRLGRRGLSEGFRVNH